jgi:ATP-dependent Clp protease ATP-binding subunit ClpA
MTKDDKEALQTLERDLKTMVYDQDKAIGSDGLHQDGACGPA